MSPQQRDTPEEHRLEEQSRRALERQPGAATASNAPWLWPVVILLSLLLWIGFWGWTSCGGWWGRHSHNGTVHSNSE